MSCSHGATHESGMQEREGWNPEAKERQRPLTELGPSPIVTEGKTGFGTDGSRLKMWWEDRELGMTPSGFSMACEAEWWATGVQKVSGERKRWGMNFWWSRKQSTGQCLWTFNVELNHMRTLFKHRRWFRRSGWSLNFCICNKLTGGTCAGRLGPLFK